MKAKKIRGVGRRRRGTLWVMHDYQRGAALLSVQEAADALCVSADTVRRWIADGLLPVEPATGRLLRIRGENVEGLLRSKMWRTLNSTPIW